MVLSISKMTTATGMEQTSLRGLLSSLDYPIRQGDCDRQSFDRMGSSLEFEESDWVLGCSAHVVDSLLEIFRLETG